MTKGSLRIPDMQSVRAADQRIRASVRQTPVLQDEGLSKALACTFFIKCEHLQRTGAFKFRGACNAIACMDEAHIKGDVATHSSGNHGAALALAAYLSGRSAHVVMPENASPLKIEAVKRNGGKIHFCPPTQQDREAGLALLVNQGHIPIPPYDHYDIIAGQGTAALELAETCPELDILIAPVGGGGLIGGTALVGQAKGMQVFAAEPAGAADTAASMKHGERVASWHPETIADGLRALIGELNFLIIKEQVARVLTVSEEEIRQAMILFWEHTHMLIEPSSAVVIAAVKAYPDCFAGKKVGGIISGANISPGDWLQLTGKLD